MDNTLIIMNGPAYGTENDYNALRAARALAEHRDVHLRIFLIGDAVTCARKDQKPVMGYYNLEKMLGSITEKGAEVAACGTCMDARAITDDGLVSGVHRSTMSELADWIVGASKVISF